MILAGAMVTLRPLQREDVPALVRWANDPLIVDLMDGGYPDTEAECLAWLEQLESSRQEKHFAILSPDRKLIGDIELDHICWRRFEAELRICIGDPAYWGHGFGTDAVTTLSWYAFKYLHLHTIFLRVYRDNSRAIRCYQKVGFRSVGRLVRNVRGVDREVYLMLLTPADLAARRSVSLALAG